jgi:hypothetical protein
MGYCGDYENTPSNFSCYRFLSVFMVSCAQTPEEQATRTATPQPAPVGEVDGQLIRYMTVLIYLAQDHEHPSTVSVSGGLGSGYTGKPEIGDVDRVAEILANECAPFTDTLLLTDLRAWPKENLIQSGVRKGERR